MTNLPTNIHPGQSGHISAHNVIHTVLNRINSPFNVVGDGQGAASARPAAGATRPGDSWYATDTGVFSRSDGSTWTEILTTEGAHTFTAEQIVQRSGAGIAWGVQHSGDATPRWRVLADGTMEWTDGTNPADIRMKRTAFGMLDMLAGKIRTKASDATLAGLRVTPGVDPTTPEDGDLWVTAANVKVKIAGTVYTFNLNGGTTFSATQRVETSGYDRGWAVRETGDTDDRWVVFTDGTMGWGSGSSPLDTFLNKLPGANPGLNLGGALALTKLLVPGGGTYEMSVFMNGDVLEFHRDGDVDVYADISLVDGTFRAKGGLSCGGNAYFGGSDVNFHAVSVANGGTAGTANPLPATPSGYALIKIRDTVQRIPFYD